MREILIATGNPGKYREISAVLSKGSPVAAGWRNLDDLAVPIPEPHEDGVTFMENAILKAHYYARASGMWTLADDSGLEIDALDGAPGVRSARFAGIQASADATRAVIDAANNRKMVALLRGVPAERRAARFRCALALSDGESILATAEGTLEGRIIDEPRGTNGFGYDPHFWLPERGCTTAELAAEEKNCISHRGQALRQMRTLLADLVADRARP